MSVVGFYLQTARCIDVLLNLIRYTYEDVPLVERRQYHGSAHTLDVIARCLAICQALGIDLEERFAGVVAAGGHDVINACSLVEREGWLVRERPPKLNEAASVAQTLYVLLIVMRMDNPLATPSELAARIILDGILSTIVEWNKKHHTVYQPDNTPAIPLAARAVGWADIGAAGMDSQAFLAEGPRLFAELNPGIMLLFEKSMKSGDIPSDMRESIRARFITMLWSQVLFAQGRRDLQKDEWEGLTRKQRHAMHKLFCAFDDSIRLSEERAHKAERTRFVPLVRQFYPDAFPGHK